MAAKTVCFSEVKITCEIKFLWYAIGYHVTYLSKGILRKPENLRTRVDGSVKVVEENK